MYAYSGQFHQQNTGEQMYENPHFNMYYPVTQQFTHNTNYSGSIHYNVYPSHLTCDNTTINNRVRARQEDEWVIEQFLQEIKRTSQVPMQSKKKKPFKIAVIKSALISVAKLNKELEDVWAELKSNVDLSEIQWQEKIDACNAKKHEICKILQNINNADFLDEVKKDLEKRKKKRLRERLRKGKWKEEKLMKTEQRTRLHAEADSWIRKKQAVIEREKQEEKLRKDADMILSDVRSKRNDARKYLGILQELQNLRKIKVNIARARGEHLSSATAETFNNSIDKLVEQWTTLDREYSTEEQGLKLMLKTNNEKRIEKETKNLFDEWEKALFGRNISTIEQCHTDLNSFIMTRTAWDKFINSENDATTIPIGWIVPEKPSSAAWQKCLMKENS